jgi:hypothetical protein
MQAFKARGSQHAILTKVDEAVKVGPRWTLIHHQIQLRGVTNGQRVPEDLSAPMRSCWSRPPRSAAKSALILSRWIWTSSLPFVRQRRRGCPCLSASPLHQGMALHMSDASTAGLRVLAVLHSARAAAEQAVLWPLCAQLQRLGQKVLVLDGSQAESFHTPGLAQLLAQHAWQAQAGLRASVGDAQSVASLPARQGLKQLKASADEMGLDMLTALQAYVRGYTTVIIYASSET